MAIENITVPDLGDATEVEVIELLVSVGQSVDINDSLLVLESEKAAMEIPAPIAGIVKSIAVNLGDQVTTGSEMMVLEVDVSATNENILDKKEDVPEEVDKKTNAETEQDDLVPFLGSEISLSMIEVPDLGTEDEVDVIEIHIGVGDNVAVDDPLITLESDKAAMEVPSPRAGEIVELIVSVGERVKKGSAIAKVKSEIAVTSEPDVASSLSNSENIEDGQTEPVSPESPPPPSIAPPSSNKVYAGPAVRKLARELGVNLTLISGTGARNRIIKEDIHDFVNSRINNPQGGALASRTMPAIDFGQFGEIEKVARTKLEKVTAVNMDRNWNSVPHVAQFNEADVTDLEAFREELKSEGERRGVKLTFMPFLLKACAKALKEYPQFNVSLHASGDYVIQKKYLHIGVAVATDAGLVVPVIRNVDQKSIWQLAEEVVELAEKASQRKLTLEEMQGACFTISSLGAIGGTGFIPIVNAPEVAILGVAKTEIKPVYIDGEFKPRKMLPLTLSYDHKVVNGVDGGMFATYLAKLLEDIRHLAL
ncbi:MAG: dihydrolipoamide acetyltransferase [Gammaproteobacteria bacterium]|nr:dihydrolipoamide acetyltransferase [Gammaproteobacteria bacterium]